MRVRLTKALSWWRHRKSWQQVGLVLVGIMWLAWLFCLPEPLFTTQYSSVVEARDGSLLSARIAKDQQWRFEPSDSLDRRYRICLLLYEDEWFDWHPGVNPVSIFRAFRQNLHAGKTVSGASTLTMQTVRLMRGQAPRSIVEKLIELAWATRLELSYSKDDILNLYAAHAPFGGNVVGLEAAAWRYYGRRPTHFSWAEAASLAVLPNAPGIIYPGRASTSYLNKRNSLLEKLHARGIIDEDDLALAKLEPLPGKAFPLPDLAPELILPGTASAWKLAPGHETTHSARLTSSLDASLQKRLLKVVEGQRKRNAGNGVHNVCALVAEVNSGKVIAYVGNAVEAGAVHGNRVDILQAPRSSGSLLKPFLYASLLDAGRISPHTLLPDIPTLIGGYAPQNFDLGFDGAVPADQALTRSLNIPHVRMLQEYGVEPLLDKLRNTGFRHLTRSADNYGLSLILGGAEVSAWEVASAYRGLAHTLNYYNSHARRYSSSSWDPISIAAEVREADAKVQTSPFTYSAAAAYLTLKTLTQLERPGDLAAWRSFNGSRRVAWKTGTSFGFRDAWAVGVTPEYVVVVWTGNADGEGRPGLTGASVAAPLLFEVFDELPATAWFVAPVADMRSQLVCATSGLLHTAACEEVDTVMLPSTARGLPLCTFHQIVYVDGDGQRVDNTCALLPMAHKKAAFVLPPAWALYYRARHPNYRGLPEWAPDCVPDHERVMTMVYPRGSHLLHLPRNLAGQRQAVVFEVAHQDPGEYLEWYLDDALVASTRLPHQQAMTPPAGHHQLLIIDKRGRQLQYQFEIVH